MKLTSLFFVFTVHSKQVNKIIQQNQYPLCKNCIYYRLDHSTIDYTYSLNKCEKFGEQNIISGKISNDYAIYNRNSKDKCGIEGKYYEKEPNIVGKIVWHYILSTSPYVMILLLGFFPLIGVTLMK
jgi:hypothetical protein